MKRRMLRLITVLAMAAGAAAACDRPTNPVAPPASDPVSPRLSVTSGGYFVGGWKLLQGSRLALQTRMDVIDARGGKINIGASSLTIPAGAVSGSTLFVFTLQTDPYISAKLVAMAMTGPAQGKLVTTFPKSLTLTISYADANQSVPDPTKVRILWMENGVLLGVQSATPDVQGKKVTTQVTHFTDWQPAIPVPCDPATSPEPCDPNGN